eukprot:jgi/Chlat1/116/Chrsp1S00221
MAAVLCMPSAANAYNLFGSPLDKDPVEPFTIYGTIFKKYLIEKIENGRVVARKKGVTAKCWQVDSLGNAVCTVTATAIEPTFETPEFRGLPIGMKMNVPGYDPRCAKGEAPTKEEACIQPCETACAAAIDDHIKREKSLSGYVVDAKDRANVLKRCSRQCINECLQPGNSSSFVAPFRP